MPAISTTDISLGSLVLTKVRANSLWTRIVSTIVHTCSRGTSRSARESRRRVRQGAAQLVRDEEVHTGHLLELSEDVVDSRRFLLVEVHGETPGRHGERIGRHLRCAP